MATPVMHYAPTTLEEEELAIALAMAASLTAQGKPGTSRPAASNRSSSITAWPGPSAPPQGRLPALTSVSGEAPYRPAVPSLGGGPQPGPSAVSPISPYHTNNGQAPHHIPGYTGHVPNAPSPGFLSPAHGQWASAPHAGAAGSRPGLGHGTSTSSPNLASRVAPLGSTPVSPTGSGGGASAPECGPGRPAHLVNLPLHPHTQPASPTRTPALPPVERSRSVGSGSGGAGGSGGGAGAGGSGGASTSSGAGLPPKGAAPAPSAALRPQVTLPPPAPLYYDPNKCAGCGKAFGLLGGAFTVAAGRKWHPACFKCGFCGEAMLPGTAFSMNPGDPRPFHPDCYKHVHIPTCHVCGTYIPIEPDGRVSWKENGFWKERFCNSHDESRLVRCCGCTRIQKHGEEWPPLPDGRHLCLHCLGSVVLDTREAQPLYEDVLAFYRDEMRLPLQYKPPVLLVDGPTLNEHARKEGRDGTDAAAPVFHVRGLCVWNAYSHMPSMMRDRSGMVRSVSTALRSAGAAAMAGIVHCSVQVVLVLYGLPRLLCGSILAHELMHAWLRMAGVVSLPLKVEEGLCQLMACLWLDRQHELLHGTGSCFFFSRGVQKPEEQRLASFFSYQIRTEPSEVYGDGFREALEAFQSHGLTAMLNNIKRYGRFLP